MTGLRDEDVPTWTEGWQAGYAAGIRRAVEWPVCDDCAADDHCHNCWCCDGSIDEPVTDDQEQQ